MICVLCKQCGHRKVMSFLFACRATSPTLQYDESNYNRSSGASVPASDATLHLISIWDSKPSLTSSPTQFCHFLQRTTSVAECRQQLCEGFGSPEGPSHPKHFRAWLAQRWWSTARHPFAVIIRNIDAICKQSASKEKFEEELVLLLEVSTLILWQCK